MNKKMSLMGVGGKIAVALVISLIVTVGIDYLFNQPFKIVKNYNDIVGIAIIMAVGGFLLNLIAAFQMMKAYKKNQLMTKGLYSIFLNPMYTVQIFVTIPGLLLLFNSWLLLITIIPLFIAFKIFVKEEERYLETRFGKQYNDYREKVMFKYL